MWSAAEQADGAIHVYPSDEQNAHWPDAYCLCMPTRSFIYRSFNLSVGVALTHNAWDGREASERVEDGSEFDDGRADTLTAWSALCEPTRQENRSRNGTGARHHDYL